MLDANALARPSVGISGHIAGREDASDVGLEVLIDEYPAIDSDASLPSQLVVRLDTDPGDHELGREPPTSVECDRIRANSARGAAQVKGDALRLVQAPNEVAKLSTEDLLQRTLAWSDDVHFQSARSKCGGDLETDEAGAENHNAPRLFRRTDDRSAIGERSQVAYAPTAVYLCRQTIWRR